MSVWEFEDHATKTIEELRDLWKEIGITEEDQNNNVKSIRDAVIECFDGAVRENRNLVKSLKKEISETELEIVSLKRELGMPEEETKEDEKKTLNENVAFLREMVSALRKEKESWIQRIGEQRDHLASLFKTLGKNVPANLCDIGSLNDERIKAFLSEIQAANTEISNRTDSVTRLIVEIRAFWEELEVEPSTELERRIAKFDPDNDDTSLGLTMDVIEGLSACAADFAEKKTKRLEEVRSLGTEITKLWTQLKVSKEDQDLFKNSHVGIGMETVKACESELLRLRKIKKERMTSLIKEFKQTVESLHVEVHAGPQQKGKYDMLIRSNKHSEDKLYDALEKYITSLRKKLEMLNPLLESIRKWQTLIEERVEYNQLIKDPSRLLSRRSGKALAQELKMAKRVTKILPKLAAKLKERLKKWEKENDELWIDGKHFVDHMELVEQEYNKENEAKKTKKKAEREKKLKSDLRYGSKPESRRANPDRTKSRSTLQPDGRPKWKGTPLGTSNKHRATVGGNVCRLKRKK